MAMAPLAALKRGLRKNSIGSIGCWRRRSHQMNATDRTAAAAKAARMTGSVQPCSGAWMIP
jgi:hypothetical protein